MAANYGGFDWSSDPQMALRMQLAKGLMQGQRAPAQSFGEGLANVGQQLVGALMARRVLDEGKGREQAANATLANALQAGQGRAAETKTYAQGDGAAPVTIDWNEQKANPGMMAQILAGNPDTAKLGTQVALGQMETKQKAEADLATALRKAALDRENKLYEPIKTEDGSVVIPALLDPSLVGQVGGRTDPTPPPAAPGPDLRTAPNAPNPQPVRREVPEIFRADIEEAARQFGVDPVILGNMLMTESGGNPQAVSPAGAKGLMQFMDATAKQYGVDVNDPRSSIFGAAHYLSDLTKQFGGDVRKAVAAYNGGPGRLQERGGNIDAMPTETRNYVTKVMPGQPPSAPPPRNVRVADASGALPPGVLYRPSGGAAGPYQGKAENIQHLNMVYRLESKMLNGETLTPQEQWQYEASKAQLQQPRQMVTDQGVINVTPPPLPSMVRSQPSAAPAPASAPPQGGPPAPAPAPAVAQPPQSQPGQPTVTNIAPKASKPIPESVQKGMLENVSALRKIDDALGALTTAGGSVGPLAGIGNALSSTATNWFDPSGTNVRALIADIGSLKIHDRSGAAVSVAEFPRLAPFIPAVGDSAEVIKTKLANFRREYEGALRDMASAYGPETGYASNPVVTETLKTGRAPRYEAPISGEDPNQPRSAAAHLSDDELKRQLGL